MATSQLRRQLALAGVGLVIVGTVSFNVNPYRADTRYFTWLMGAAIVSAAGIVALAASAVVLIFDRRGHRNHRM